MLAFVREFAERVRQKGRLELAIVLVAGLCGLAMTVPGGQAYTAPQNVSTLFRPDEETARVSRIVIVCAGQKAVAVAPLQLARPPLPPVAPAPQPVSAPPPVACALGAPVWVRGPPIAPLPHQV